MNQQVTDLLKTQLILGANGSGSWNGLRNIVCMNLYDTVVATFPVWSRFISANVCRRRSTKPVETPPPNKEVRCEIAFERHKEEKQSKHIETTVYQQRTDAIIHSISKVSAIRHLLSIVNHDYLPYEFEPIKVDSDIYFQLTDLKHSDGNIETLKFKLFCYDHEIIFLQAYVETCNTDYERHMKNKLGSHKYFFNMIVPSKSKGTMQNPLPTSHIVFTKHKFQTSRTFDNVFFEQRANVETHTEFFLKRKDWYEKKGIPHTLGFMFHGEPGCGKTSTIKAIANVGNRHIINIHLSEIKSKEQLSHLFFNDEIHVLDNQKTERYTIPVNERMYVIEDIDAMGDTVLRREWKRPEPVTAKKEPFLDAFGNIIEEQEKNPIDLSFLLNLLDGTLESTGRIIAISTNFPERIDRALIRPGRIDMIIHFKKCSLKVLREMTESFYDKQIESNIWTIPELNEKWSPAEVNQILFRNFKNHEKAMHELETLSRDELYGFSLSGSDL